MSTKLQLAFMIAVAGCASSTTIESTWHAQNPPQLNNVVTLSPAPDPALRRSAEDNLAQQLSQHGVHARPAYTVVSDQDRADPDHIVAALQAQGFDGVVTMRLVDARQTLQTYPAFGPYWAGAWGATVVPETVVRLEVNAYSLATKQLVFSARSKTVDPGTAKQVIGDVSRVAVNQLAQDHVIGPAQAAQGAPMGGTSARRSP